MHRVDDPSASEDAPAGASRNAISTAVADSGGAAERPPLRLSPRRRRLFIVTIQGFSLAVAFRLV
jgi:hypothetical protein